MDVPFVLSIFKYPPTALQKAGAVGRYLQNGSTGGLRHLAVCTKVMHSGLDAVTVGGHPHICVLVHHAAAGVEEVVVLANLRQALRAHAVGVVRY